jgi:hypothetical protein
MHFGKEHGRAGGGVSESPGRASRLRPTGAAADLCEDISGDGSSREHGERQPCVRAIAVPSCAGYLEAARRLRVTRSRACGRRLARTARGETVLAPQGLLSPGSRSSGRSGSSERGTERASYGADERSPENHVRALPRCDYLGSRGTALAAERVYRKFRRIGFAPDSAIHPRLAEPVVRRGRMNVSLHGASPWHPRSAGRLV